MVQPDARDAGAPHPVGRPYRAVPGGLRRDDDRRVPVDGPRLQAPRGIDAGGGRCVAARLPEGSRAGPQTRVLGRRAVLRLHRGGAHGRELADPPAVRQRLVLRPRRPRVRPRHLLLRLHPAGPEGPGVLPDERRRDLPGGQPGRLLPVRHRPTGPPPPRLQARPPADGHAGRRRLPADRRELLAGPLRAAHQHELQHEHRRGHVLRHQRDAARAFDPRGDLRAGRCPLRGRRLPRDVAPARVGHRCDRGSRPGPGDGLPRAHPAVQGAPQPAHPGGPLHPAQHRRDSGGLRPGRCGLPDQLRRGDDRLGGAVR